MKRGYQTSEFWFTLVTFIVSGLFLFGVIKETDTRDNLIEVITHTIESIILIAGQFAVFARYLEKRKEVKVEYERRKQKEQDNLRKELEDYVGVDKRHDKININTASLGELIQLPHIGPALAQKIIDHRNNVGQFENIFDIVQVNGIGDLIFNDIKAYIVL